MLSYPEFKYRLRCQAPVTCKAAKTMYELYKYTTNTNTLAPLDELECVVVPLQKGNNPMYMNEMKPRSVATAGVTVIGSSVPVDTAESQRLFLAERMFSIQYEKAYELRKQFKIDFSYRPKTVQEAAERIKAGLFTLTGADKTEPVKYSWLENIFSWRGPDDQADEAGYKVARAALETLFRDSMDKIRIADPKDGLVILEAFKDWTFTPAPVVTPAVA